MEIQKFIEEFAGQFDYTDTANFQQDTRFKETEEWNSMTALMVIAMVDDVYNVKLNGADIKGADTIADVYNIVASRFKE